MFIHSFAARKQTVFVLFYNVFFLKVASLISLAAVQFVSSPSSETVSLSCEEILRFRTANHTEHAGRLPAQSHTCISTWPHLEP